MEMSLKHLLSKLLSTERQSIIISYKQVPGLLVRCGKVVTFTTAADWRSLPIGGFTTVATIPEGWRPPDIVYVADATKSAVYIRILTDGSVQTYNSGSSVLAAQNGRYATTWVVE